MPELPEVETTVKGISPFLQDKIIKEIIVRNDRLRWPVNITELNQLQNATIQTITRRSKYIIISTEKGDILLHLGMSGTLRILQNKQEPEKHDHIDLVTKSGVILRYNDPRRFGCWLFSENANKHKLLTELAIEPLDKDFNAKYLFATSRNKKIALKKFLMNQKYVVGVGNIYASESLFISKLHPELLASNLTLENCEILVTAIKKVLKASIKQGGTTLKDFTQPDGKPGYFAQKLKVYGKNGESCEDCNTPIISKMIAGRNTFYCPSCQRI